MYESANYGAEVLIPFPNHLFSSDEDKHAALAYNACFDAVAFMKPIVRLLLEGKHYKGGYLMLKAKPG